jgi:hypothetical protein
VQIALELAELALELGPDLVLPSPRFLADLPLHFDFLQEQGLERL